jgi:hypothetical protein
MLFTIKFPPHSSPTLKQIQRLKWLWKSKVFREEDGEVLALHLAKVVLVVVVGVAPVAHA